MNNKELRAAGQLMIDFADKKVKGVESRSHGHYFWKLSEPTWNWFRYDYRAVPELKLRPYTRAEMIELVGETLQKKITDIQWRAQWLHVGKLHTYLQMILAYGEGTHAVTPEDLLAGWTHLDGSPCGVEVQNDA